ncbi:MAG: hypothetical protein JRH11_17420 [Deltaproteobacteria bacterium]|nr:hypothetical protein [Deltaproteobacteria bacterium]
MPALVVLGLSLGAGAYLDLRSRVASLEDREPSTTAAVELPPRDAASPVERVEPNRVPPAAPEGSIERDGEAPDWDCAGTIDRELVQVTVGLKGTDVFACHSARATTVPGLSDSIRLLLHVRQDGKVDGAHVTGANDDVFVRCVGELALTWQFPPPVGGECAIVEVPFSLGG